MTRRAVIETVVCALVAAFIVIAIKQYVGDRELLARADEVKKASIEKVAEQQKIIDSLSKNIADRDALAAKQTEQIAALAKSIKTAKQAIAALPQVTASGQDFGLKEVTTITPATAGDFSMPKEQALPLFNALAQCKTDAINLKACTADKIDMAAQLVASIEQRKSAEHRAEKDEIALKGGTWKHRAFKILKPLGCAAAGAAAGTFSKNKPAGAAIGSAAGGLACALF